MKKLLLISILLMFLVGNAFADEFVDQSRGQKIYIPCQHILVTLIPGLLEHIVTTRINVRNYDGDARIEYIEYYGVDQNGNLLEPVKMILSPTSGESYDLPPWSNWYWETSDFLGPPTQPYPNRANPFFIIKWVSTNGKKISAPSFRGSTPILQGLPGGIKDLKAILLTDVTILEE